MIVQPVAILSTLVVATVSIGVPQEIPSELLELTDMARLDGTVTVWCNAEFRDGYPGAFALGLTSAAGGRYLAIDTDGSTAELGRFEQSAEVACYSRAEAEALDLSIRQTFVKGWGSLTPYLNLVNAYNRRNVLFYFYEYDRSPPVRSGVSMFPILPTVGVEVRF